MNTEDYTRAVAYDVLRKTYGFEVSTIYDGKSTLFLCQAEGVKIVFLLSSRWHTKDNSTVLLTNKTLEVVEKWGELLGAIPAICLVGVCGTDKSKDTKVILASLGGLRKCIEEGGEANRPVQKRDNGIRITYTDLQVETIKKNTRLAYFSIETHKDPKNAYLSTFIQGI